MIVDSSGDGELLLNRFFIQSIMPFIVNIQVMIVQYSDDDRENTTTLFSGSEGVMPGIKLGRFTAEFRLGVAAYYSKMKSPEGSADKNIRKSKRAALLYPSKYATTLFKLRPAGTITVTDC